MRPAYRKLSLDFNLVAMVFSNRGSADTCVTNTLSIVLAEMFVDSS